MSKNHGSFEVKLKWVLADSGRRSLWLSLIKWAAIAIVLCAIAVAIFFPKPAFKLVWEIYQAIGWFSGSHQTQRPAGPDPPFSESLKASPVSGSES